MINDKSLCRSPPRRHHSCVCFLKGNIVKVWSFFFFFCGFHIVRTCSRGKEETIKSPKRKKKLLKKHLNLQVCTEQTAAVFLWHPAYQQVFDLMQRNRFSSNTSFVKSIYNVNKNYYIIYLFFQLPAFPCCHYNPLKRQCGDWFHLRLIFGLATFNF